MLVVKTKAQQNLVPNPSFEEYTNCPTAFGQATFATGWQSFRSSPDYFNSCANYASGLSLPKNDPGYQIPANGNAYVGLIGFTSFSENDFEAIGIQLLNPLSIGVKYYVSMKVCLASKDPVWCNAASDHIGISFSKNVFDVLNPKPLNNSAKVYSNIILNDTANWSTLSGDFIADSVYQYIILGNFFNTINTNTLALFSSSSYGSYYFIDDVKLSTDSSFVNEVFDLKKNDELIILSPNPFEEYIEINARNHVSLDVRIYNFSGRLVYSNKLKNIIKYQIHTSELLSGNYLITIRDLETNQTILNNKLIKK